MKTKIKLFILLIIALAIYLIFPRTTSLLIYISKDQKYSLLKQDTPMNTLDIFCLNMFHPKEGWIRLHKKTNKYKLYKAILFAPREKTRAMVMYGGETMNEFIQKISKQAHLNPKKLRQVYSKLARFKEGSIIAQHYSIPYHTTEQSTISYMINQSYSFFQKVSKKYATPLDSSAFKQKIIIASILEKETQKYAQMPLIASVIYNRLKRGMRLQIDATLNYGKQTHTIVTPKLIRTDSSSYNTYKHKGLPPTPLASPSKPALVAAFNPAQTGYLYFVKGKNSLHTFSVGYKTHQAGVKAYKKRLSNKRAYNKKISALILKNAKRILTPRPFIIKPTVPKLLLHKVPSSNN